MKSINPWNALMVTSGCLAWILVTWWKNDSLLPQTTSIWALTLWSINLCNVFAHLGSPSPHQSIRIIFLSKARPNFFLSSIILSSDNGWLNSSLSTTGVRWIFFSAIPLSNIAFFALSENTTYCIFLSNDRNLWIVNGSVIIVVIEISNHNSLIALTIGLTKKKCKITTCVGLCWRSNFFISGFRNRDNITWFILAIGRRLFIR